MEMQVPADGGGAPVPVEQRLAEVEHRLDALEGSMREAITQELQATSEEMRRAVSELGRLLLRDLDRLTKVLAEHRDAIVERLSAVTAAGPTGPASAGPAAAGPEPGHLAAHAVPGDEHEEPAAPAAMTGEDGRWWALPGRRRHRRA